jgi:hypothetical protein
VHPDNQHPRRNHNLYSTLSNSNTMAGNVELSTSDVHLEFHLFRHSPCIVMGLLKPYLLHTMRIGILDHLQKSIFHFMKLHERVGKFKGIWLSLPAYHDLTPKDKSYEEVSQWNGKERVEMNWYLLGVVTQSQRGGSPPHRPIFNHSIECTLALFKFCLYAQYKS